MDLANGVARARKSKAEIRRRNAKKQDKRKMTRTIGKLDTSSGVDLPYRVGTELIGKEVSTVYIDPCMC